MRYEGKKQSEISFPLGGIGTGSIGLGGNGRLLDWEIFNRPDKGSVNGYSHFAVRAVDGEGGCKARVLAGDLTGSYVGQYSKATFRGYGFGPACETMCGYPHFSSCAFEGRFPVAHITFSDPDFPARIVLKAFNPMIPGDALHSSLPAAFFEVEIENLSGETLTFGTAFSVSNPFSLGHSEPLANGVRLVSALPKEDVDYGDLTLLAGGEAFVQANWYRGKWQDAPVTYWNEFSSGKTMTARCYGEDAKKDTCTVLQSVLLKSGEKKSVRFLLSWSQPTCYKYWGKAPVEEKREQRWKNYYATQFSDSTVSASYCLRHWEMLWERTLRFCDALYSTTLDERLLDRITANLAVLKSPTVLRLPDGSFWGWEGVHEREGSCEGTCQHVWNYAYALCFLFPELERSIREQELRFSTSEAGMMDFRLMLPPGAPRRDTHACVDGQMGSVMKIYRDWRITGDGEWIRERWEQIKRIVSYAWSEENPHAWDRDRDGVLEGRQHHTLDMELFGPSSWLEGFYLGALRAAAEMARFVGDRDAEKEYLALFEKGYAWTRENLFNGSYFLQRIDLFDRNAVARFGCEADYWNEETGEIKYQIGEGCEIDQLVAQWHADLSGLGDLFDPVQTRTALQSLYKNNFKPTMRNFTNPWRVFSLGDEGGAVICDYPEGVQKPTIPIPYCEETMTGFEYALAGLLISRGFVEEGKRIVYALADRFDGEHRNPWNEFECGSNYARSMASFALLPIFAGFSFDLSRGYLGFDPVEKGDYTTFWSLGGAYGTFALRRESATLTVFEGRLSICRLGLPAGRTLRRLLANGQEIRFECLEGEIAFEPLSVEKGVELLFA